MKAALTKLYRLVTGLERLFFRTFDFLSYRPQAKVIAIGNLSMGGTGKTPVLFELLEELSLLRPCVLTRGYRSPWERSFFLVKGAGQAPAEMTDEVLMLNQRFPETPILIGKNRHHSAIMADILLSPALMLLDDGFQYRRLKKDINLLLWDAMSTEQEARLIPEGRLREPVWRLSDADAIMLTRCELAEPGKIEFWQNWLRRESGQKPVILMQTQCEGIFTPDGKIQETDTCRQPWLAFSAIGRPDSFYGQIKLLGGRVAEKVEFRDHHRFSETELDEIASAAKKRGLPIICTEKDASKISPERLKKDNIHVLRIRTKPISGSSITEELKKYGINLL